MCVYLFIFICILYKYINNLILIICIYIYFFFNIEFTMESKVETFRTYYFFCVNFSKFEYYCEDSKILVVMFVFFFFCDVQSSINYQRKIARRVFSEVIAKRRLQSSNKLNLSHKKKFSLHVMTIYVQTS